MNYEFWIAKRYIWSKRRHPFVGVISTISVLGLCVGVAALIVVLAVMNGFDEELKSRIIGARAHVVIEKDGAFNNAPGLLDKLRQNDLVAGASPYVEGQALIQKGESATGVLVRGVDTQNERSVSKFYDYLTSGTLSESPGGVAVGSELAKRFGLKIGSEFLLLTQFSKKPFKFTVEGIFSSGMYEYDANLIFLSLPNAQNVFEMKDGVSGISIFLKRPELANRVKAAIQKHLGYPYYVRTWMDMNKTLFGALKLEKTVMFLILALIILVACLNIAGSLTILVMDKTKDIGILKALGSTPLSLMKIFAYDGLVVGALGTGAGFLIGSGLCALLKKYSFVELPREIYYMDRLPVRINLWDAAAVLCVALFLSFLSALYPAVVAGKLDPVKALRYE